MPDLATLVLKIESSEARQAKIDLEEMLGVTVRVEQQANKVTQAHNQMGVSLGSLGRIVAQLTAGFTVLAVARTGMENAFASDRIEKGFENILGSVNQAATVVNQLKDFSNNSQFGFAGLADTAREFVALGVSGEKAVSIVKSIGTALENLGSAHTDITSISTAFNRMLETGQANMFIFRTLSAQGIPAIRYLADALGVSMPKAMQLLREGAISGKDAVDAISAGLATLNDHAINTQPTFTQLRAQIGNQLTNAFGELFTTFSKIVNLRGLMESFSTTLRIVVSSVKEAAEGTGPWAKALKDVEIVIQLIIEAELAVWALKTAKALWGLTTQLFNTGVVSNSLVIGLLLITSIDLADWATKQFKALAIMVTGLQAAFQVAMALGKYMASSPDMDKIGQPGKGPSSGRSYNDLSEQVASAMDTFMRQNKQIDDNINAGLAPGGGSKENPLEGIVSRMNSQREALSKALFPDRGGLRFMEGPSEGGGTIGTTLSENVLDRIKNMVDKPNEEADLSGLDKQSQDRAKQMKTLQDLLEKYSKSSTEGEGLTYMNALGNAIDRLQAIREIDTIAKGMGNSFSSAFGEFITGAKKSQIAIVDLGKSIQTLLVKQLVEQPLSQGLGTLLGSRGLMGTPGTASQAGTGLAGFFGSLFGGPSGPNTSGNNTVGGFTTEGALGGVWTGGVRTFATGGIFDTPTSFGLAGGQLGVMGEDGPEAVMPLTRGPNGKLGVVAQGSGGQQVVHNHNITMNIRTNDADSFKKSSRQITSDMKRATNTD